jgi:sugar phosphate isomerase/epimerase
MKHPMYKYMKVGLIHFMAYPEAMSGEGEILETLKKVAVDEYFNAIEVTWIKNDETRERARDMLQSSHLHIAYGSSPRTLTTGLNPNDINEEGRKKAVETLKAGIDEAYYLGAKAYSYLSGKYDEDKKDEAYAALVKSTMEICEYAKSKGDMKIALEVFDYDIDKKSIIGPAPLARRFAEDIRMKHNNFGLLVDLSHIPLLHESIKQSILPVAEYIIHAHMGNCVVKDPSLPGYGDLHPRFGFENGENDVEQLTDFLRVLLDIGFLNEQDPPIVSFEVKPFGDEDPDIVVANAKRTLNEAWARL